MRIHTLLVILAGGAVSAGCTSERLVSPPAGGQAFRASAAKAAEYDPPVVSPVLAELDARLAAAGSNLRVAKAEFIVDTSNWTGASQTLIANDRARGLGSEWVAGDPRRDGRVGVTYTFDPRQGREPFTRNPDGSGLRQVPFPDLEPFLEEAMSAWRDQTCSSAPIERVAVPAGVDPDLLDQFFLGSDGGRPYEQVSDIVQGGWQVPGFFTAIAGPDGDNIIGVTFTFWYVDDNDVPTDINGDGKRDTGLAEIYYNTRFAWGDSQALNVVDYYSILTHETGHAMGLAHFGKVFITKHDAADGIQIADIKYAPLALMNAVYVTGRGEIEGTDNSSFCMIWASKK
jgi:hypothetical protein